MKTSAKIHFALSLLLVSGATASAFLPSGPERTYTLIASGPLSL